MPLEYRIASMDSFRVVGVMSPTTNEDGKGMQDIPALWGELVSSGKQLEILPLMSRKPYGLLGINVYNTDAGDARKFDYYIACASDQPAPEGMCEYTVPAYTWGIFPCRRAQVGEVMLRIVTDWLPTSKYELVNTGYESGFMQGGAPDIEVYGESDDVEIWIAVNEKQS